MFPISVSGIPMLVVLKSDGKMVTKNGRETIKSHGPNAVKEWLTSTHVFETVSSGNGGGFLTNEELKIGELRMSKCISCNMHLDEHEPGESGNSQFYCCDEGFEQHSSKEVFKIEKSKNKE